MDPVQPLVRVLADLLLCAPDHLSPSRREVRPVRLQVPVPQPVVAAFGGQRIALLTLAEGAFDFFALLDFAFRCGIGELEPRLPELGVKPQPGCSEETKGEMQPGRSGACRPGDNDPDPECRGQHQCEPRGGQEEAGDPHAEQNQVAHFVSARQVIHMQECVYEDEAGQNRSNGLFGPGRKLRPGQDPAQNGENYGGATNQCQDCPPLQVRLEKKLADSGDQIDACEPGQYGVIKPLWGGNGHGLDRRRIG